jgi:hypothetical protein
MAEDSGTTTLGSTKRCGDQVISRSRPKRVKVDTRPSNGANPPNSNPPDTPQGTKKSQKRRAAAGNPKSRQGKEKDGGENVGRRRREGPETGKAADMESEADTRDRPVSEKPPHGFGRTLPSFDPIVVSSEQDLEGEARRLPFASLSKGNVNEEGVEDASLLRPVEGAVGVMDIEDGPEGRIGRIQQWLERIDNNDTPDKV